MSDTETGTDPEPIFSAEDGLEKLWVQAYQGEVLGEELFERVAAQLDEDGEPEHAAKVRVLATLELRTKEAIAPALARAPASPPSPIPRCSAWPPPSPPPRVTSRGSS